MRVFLSGQYSADHPRKILENVNRAILHGIAIMCRGHSVFIPHLFHYVHLNRACPFEYEEYLRNDLEWLEVSDVLYRMPADSKGADIEVARAKELGIPVVYSLDELEKVSGL